MTTLRPLGSLLMLFIVEQLLLHSSWSVQSSFTCCIDVNIYYCFPNHLLQFQLQIILMYPPVSVDRINNYDVIKFIFSLLLRLSCYVSQPLRFRLGLCSDKPWSSLIWNEMCKSIHFIFYVITWNSIMWNSVICYFNILIWIVITVYRLAENYTNVSTIVVSWLYNNCIRKYKRLLLLESHRLYNTLGQYDWNAFSRVQGPLPPSTSHSSSALSIIIHQPWSSLIYYIPFPSHLPCKMFFVWVPFALTTWPNQLTVLFLTIPSSMSYLPMCSATLLFISTVGVCLV